MKANIELIVEYFHGNICFNLLNYFTFVFIFTTIVHLIEYSVQD